MSFLLLLGACQKAVPQDDGPIVLTTIAMIADVAQNVAGPCLEVRPLMGPGTDPHTYRASARDSRDLGRANLILYSGYGLEGEFGELLGRIGERRNTLAVAEAAIPEDVVIRTDNQYGRDPHVWMDVQLWGRTATVIAEALGQLEPDCAAAMLGRAANYRRELAALDAWVQASIRSIPRAQRILITAHDAFNYYSRAYGLEVAGIQGTNTATEAAIVDIRRTAETIVSRRVPAIFVESSINPRTIDAVRQAAASEGVRTRIGGQLYSDALGEAGTADGTYIGMIVHNTRTLTDALGGSVPPLPAALGGWTARWSDDPLPSRRE